MLYDTLANKQWWISALIRTVRTMAETALSIISTSMVLSDVNWKLVASATVLSGILTMLTALKGLPEVRLQKQLSEEEHEDDIDTDELM